MAKGNGQDASSGLTKVRTTFTPHRVIEVDQAELDYLTRKGLIHKGEAPAEPDDTKESTS